MTLADTGTIADIMVDIDGHRIAKSCDLEDYQQS
jgi:hypothetical protein